MTLKVTYWGDFGFDELQDAYREVAPNVTLQLVEQAYDPLHGDLRQQLLANRGAPDVVAIDEGFITQFRDLADRFVDLRTQPGGAARQGDYLAWKWRQSLGPRGQQIGLGLDAGGAALCYRRDLLQAAGLPADRDALAALWPDWKSFAAVAARYTARTHKPFLDNAAGLFPMVLDQQPVGYFSADGKLAVNGGPKATWNSLAPLTEPGISARLPLFSSEWDAGMAGGGFAVMECPMWMLGHIQEAAPSTSGRWDIAPLPGVSGNWGGSFLTIPRQGRHPAEAWKFVDWVTRREQQQRLFVEVGLLPTQPAALAAPELQEFEKAFFNHAPVGKIYQRSIQNLPAQYLGSRSGDVQAEVESAFWQVELGKGSASSGWRAAVRAARAAARG